MVNYFRKMIKMNNLVKSLVFSGLIIICLSSCNPTKKYEEREAAEIQQYLSDHPDLDFVLKESGLYYMDLNIGPGNQVEKSDTAFVYYTGYFLNGTEFDSNVGESAFVFPTGEGWVIPGFDEGVMLMREGGTAKFLIPSYLGYGNSGYYMPAYTPTLFEVVLDSLVAGPGGK
jgi:FKBP-type peptidyl-prolyl cis-trans isomerase